jgi:hypothetical protein
MHSESITPLPTLRLRIATRALPLDHHNRPPPHNQATTDPLWHSMPNQHTKKRKAAAATQNDSDAESSTTGGVHDNDIGFGTGKGDVNEPGITLYVFKTASSTHQLILLS